jgi:hypothetical protein
MEITMPTFLAGLVLGALSGAVTYWLSQDSGLAAAVGLIVAVTYWLGVWLLLVIDI